MKVKWTTAAANDLAEIVLYISEYNPVAAVKVANLVREKARSLAEMPYAHRAGVVEGTRELVANPYPYVVVYRIDEEAKQVNVLTVYHTARKYPPM